MTAVVAHSQAPGSAAPAAAPSASPGSAAPEPAREPDEEDAGSGSGRALVAPAEPKARLVWLHDRVLAAIAAQPRLAAARIAVSVIDLATGHDVIAIDADRAMSLA